MRCVDCQASVEDYFDGELDEQTTRQVTQHLGVCTSCASLYEKLEEEQKLYLSYEYDTEPAPDFWDNVLAQTTKESADKTARPFSILRHWFGGALGRFNAPRLSPSLAALLVLFAIGITVAVMRYVNSPEESAAPVNVAQNTDAFVPAPPPPQNDEAIKPGVATEDNQAIVKEDRQVAQARPQLAKNRAARKDRNPALSASNERNVRVSLNPEAAGRKPTSDELVREAEQKYVAAIAMLSRDVNRRRSRLDPAMSARFAQTLAAVDRTIADTRRAARQHPGDPVAAQYMLTAYAKKVEVLREIIGY